MMQRQLVRKLLCGSPFGSVHRPFSTAIPPIKSPFAVEYLVKSCGVPIEKAINAFKCISHLKSPAKPDSVLQFLQERGLSGAGITRAVGFGPRLLGVSLENHVAQDKRGTRGWFLAFPNRSINFTLPNFFHIHVWRFIAKEDRVLGGIFGVVGGILSALKRAPYLLHISVEKVVEPNISFLEKQHCGISPSQIRKMISRDLSILTNKPNKLKEARQRAEELGSPHGSGLFMCALQMTFKHSPSNVAAKINNLKNIGFSKEEIDSMIKKQPILLANSEEKIQSNIGFLTSEAGLDLSYIARYPTLLFYSFERRIIRRHHVLKSLKSKGLCENWILPCVMYISEKRFGDRFVSLYKDIFPEVFEAFEAARTGKILLKVKTLQEKDCSRI